MSVSKRSRHSLGITCLELVIVSLIVVLLLGILLPGLSSSDHGHRFRYQSLANLRQIQIGFISVAMDNRDRYPGMADYCLLQSGAAGTVMQSGLNGTSVEHRFASVLDYIGGGDVLISPFDERKTFWTSELKSTALTEAHYSYALLRIHSVPTADHAVGLQERTLDQGARTQAWTAEDAGAEAVMLGDRAIRNADGHLRSIQTLDSKKRGDDWQGGIGWGDGHVTQESSHEVDTQYPDASAIRDDHLFRTDQGNATFAVPGEGPWDEVMDNANAVLDAVGSSAGVEATRMTGE